MHASHARYDRVYFYCTYALYLCSRVSFRIMIKGGGGVGNNKLYIIYGSELKRTYIVSYMSMKCSDVRRCRYVCGIVEVYM